MRLTAEQLQRPNSKKTASLRLWLFPEKVFGFSFWRDQFVEKTIEY
jgi:hypothetical protein